MNLSKDDNRVEFTSSSESQSLSSESQSLSAESSEQDEVDIPKELKLGFDHKKSNKKLFESVLDDLVQLYSGTGGAI